jgi:hypothetical protein
MKTILFSILYCLIILSINCTNLNGPKYNTKVFFTLFTTARDTNSLLDISFQTFDTLNENPIIFLNGKTPDTIENNIGNFWATFRNVYSDSSIHYQFSLFDDTINQVLLLPGEIDSLFCNNQYLPYGDL